MADQAATPLEPAQVQQAIKDATVPPGAEPVEIKTSTGQVFKGATTDEVIAQMRQSIEHGTTTIHQQRQELEQARQHAQPPAPQVPISDDDKVNATYWEKLGRSAMEAQNYLDSIRLGIPEDQVPQVLRGTLQQTQVNLQQQAGTDFQARCPDFPSNNPAAVQTLVNAMKQRYGASAPSNAAELADRLEVTYGQLVRSNQITPADLPIARYNSAPVPPLGSSGNAPSIDILNEQNFRRLTPDQMRDAILRLEQQGHK